MPELNVQSFHWHFRMVKSLSLPISQFVTWPDNRFMEFGPAGKVISPLSAVALHKVSSPDISETALSQTVSRALMAEAALDLIGQMNEAQLESSGIQEAMRSYVNKYMDVVTALAPKIRHALITPVFRVTLDVLRKRQDYINWPERNPYIPDPNEQRRASEMRKRSEGRGPPPGPREFQLTGEPVADPRTNGEKLFNAVLKSPTRVLNGSFLGTGKFMVALRDGLVGGVSVFDTLPEGVAGKQDAQAEDEDKDEMAKVLDTFAKRALFGEAALQAVLEKDLEWFEEKRYYGGRDWSSSGLDVIKNNLQEQGERVLLVWPVLLKGL